MHLRVEVSGFSMYYTILVYGLCQHRRALTLPKPLNGDTGCR